MKKITVNKKKAASILGCGINTVLALSKSGELPCAKIGREYIYVVEDLVKYIRSRYPSHQLVAQDQDKEILCQSLSARTPKSGKSLSVSTDREYAKVLGLPTNQKQSKRRHN